MAEPSLVSDVRVYLAGAPWRLTLLADRYVRGFRSEETLLNAKLEISDEDVIFRYSDPPDSP